MPLPIVLQPGANRRSFKHGYSHTRIYKCWEDIKKRCLNPHSSLYKYYGGRGITVCERWFQFANFLADMGECPPGLTIERKDNDGPYCKDNCKWATMEEQSKNKRVASHVKLVTCWGETKTVADWARDSRIIAHGLALQTLYSRLAHGLRPEAAFGPKPDKAAQLAVLNRARDIRWGRIHEGDSRWHVTSSRT